jgi:hypothetical protein
MSYRLGQAGQQALSLSMLQCPFCGHTAAAKVAEVAKVCRITRV